MNLSKENIKKILFIAFCVIAFYFLLENYSLVLVGISYLFSLLFPFILGGAIAFVINVPMRFFERHLYPKSKNKKLISLRRVFAYFISLICIFGIIVLAMFVVIPQLITTISNVVEQVPAAADRALVYIKRASTAWPYVEKYVSDISFDWGSIIKKIASFAQTGAVGMLNTGFVLISSLISSITTFVIGFVFSIYVLFQKEKLSIQAKQVFYAILHEKFADRLIYVLRLSNVTFANFLSGQCTDACVLGFMFFITLSIIRFPYALLIGVLIAFTALIPIVGAFMGCAISVFLIAIENPMKALIFIGIFLVLQQLEGNLIYPKIVGNSIGLPAIWVLVAITIGGQLMGVVGMLIFIPISSILYTLFKEFIFNRLKKRNISSKKWLENGSR